METTNQMELLTVKDAAKYVGKSTGTIREWHRRGYIKGIKQKVLMIYKPDLDSYLQSKNKKGVCNPFGNAFPKCGELFQPLYTLQQGHICYPSKPILVGDMGTVWNVVDGHIYGDGAIDTNGHIQIRIDRRLYYPHKLIAMRWCPNSKFKQNVHHINGVKTDNKKDNLLFVTCKEHKNLGNYLKKMEELDPDSTEYQKINAEYQEKVDEIRKDNQPDEENEKNGTLFPFIDIEESSDKWLVVYFVDYKGFCLLLSGFSLDDVIRDGLLKKEYHCINEGKKTKEGKTKDTKEE